MIIVLNRSMIKVRRVRWIPDPDAHTISQYNWHDSHYDKAMILRAGDRLTCPLFPTVTLAVAEAFAGAL